MTADNLGSDKQIKVRVHTAFERLTKTSSRPIGVLVLCSTALPLFALATGDVWPLAIFGVAQCLLLLHIYGVATTASKPVSVEQPGAPQAVRNRTDEPASNSLQNPESTIPIADQTELVTIVVPLYNEATYIRDCIDSIQAQTWQKWHCIVVDDASTDSGPAIVDEYCRLDDRIELVRHQKNNGLSAARNTGLRMAGSQLITFLDSDDMLLPHAVESRVFEFRKYRKDPSVVGAYCGIQQVAHDASTDYRPTSLEFPAGFHDLLTTQADCPFNVHAPLVRTAVLRALGGFDETMKNGAEDWDLWQRVLRHGYYFRSAAIVGGFYRRKPNSMASSLSTAHISEAATLYGKATQPLQIASTEDGVHPLTAPVHEYPVALRFTKRLITFAAMAYVQGGANAFAKTLEHLPDIASSFFLRHLKVEGFVSTGVKRAMALSDEMSMEEKELHDETVERIAGLVRESLHQADRYPGVEDANPVDVLFYVTDSHEAQLVSEWNQAQDRDEHSAAALIVDAVNGNQGAGQHLQASGIRTYSMNEFALQAPPFRSLVIFRKAGFGIEYLADAANQDGIPAFLHESPQSTDPENAPALPTTNSVQSIEEIGVNGSAKINHSQTNTRGQFGLRYRSDVLRREEPFDASPDAARIKEFRDKHKNERCVIVGNGPSLNDTDLSLLDGETTIAVNGIFYKTEEVGFLPTYYVVEDTSVMKENTEAINAYSPPFKFFPTQYRPLHSAGDDVFFFRMNRGFYEKKSPNYCVPRFSVDFADRAYCGQSVTYINLQLAYFMGFSEVYLIGMDFDYLIPDSAIVKGDLILSTEDDPNHFNGAYFGEGKTWKDPKLDRVLQNYAAAKRIYEADGRQIFNATLGGKLELFERVDYQSVFGSNESNLKKAN